MPRSGRHSFDPRSTPAAPPSPRLHSPPIHLGRASVLLAGHNVEGGPVASPPVSKLRRAGLSRALAHALRAPGGAGHPDVVDEAVPADRPSAARTLSPCFPCGQNGSAVRAGRYTLGNARGSCRNRSGDRSRRRSRRERRWVLDAHHRGMPHAGSGGRGARARGEYRSGRSNEGRRMVGRTGNTTSERRRGRHRRRGQPRTHRRDAGAGHDSSSQRAGSARRPPGRGTRGRVHGRTSGGGRWSLPSAGHRATPDRTSSRKRAHAGSHAEG